MRKVTRTVLSPPRTKARPRLGRRNRAYTPAATVAAEHTVADAFQGVDPFDGPVAVKVRYFKDRQVVTIMETDSSSKLRGDIDNYEKLTLDGLQRSGVLPNDRQVVRLTATKE